jgi:hypothetical protein
LGEPFVVEIVVAHDGVQRYEFETPGSLGDFDFIGIDRARVDEPQASVTTFQVRLAAFALGKHATPSLSLAVAGASTEPKIVVPGVEIEVVSSLPKDSPEKGAELFDVRPPEEVLVRTWSLLYWLGGVALAVVLGWLLIRRLRRKPPSRAVEIVPLAPLEVRTRQALDALAGENLPENAQFKTFYFRLSEILRSYIGERFGFDALECTTPELLSALRSRATPGLRIEDMSSFAALSDLVRYAKTEPTPNDCKRHLELVYQIVTATTLAHATGRPPNGLH